MAIAVFDALDDLRLAHHAAAEKNFLLRVPGLGVYQRADVAVDAGFRVLTDGAGVDNDAVRALFGVHDLIAACAQHPADALGIRLVLLAAVCIDKGRGVLPREAQRALICSQTAASFSSASCAITTGLRSMYVSSELHNLTIYYSRFRGDLQWSKTSSQRHRFLQFSELYVGCI